MSAKIRSALVGGDTAAGLREKYEEIYRSSGTWLYSKSQGVHTAIAHLLGSAVDGARVLDVGCGAGRLALMLSRRADQVDGFDFSPTAVEIARLNTACTNTHNVSITESDLGEYAPDGRYDVITLVGTLEHLPDPVQALRKLHSWLRTGGLLVVSCPAFLNFRGNVYMTLLTLLDLPMSLADLRQVYPWDIRKWAASSGFELARSAGALYRFGWDQKAGEDLIKRVPAALRDKGAELGQLDIGRFGGWLMAQAEASQSYLESLHQRGILRTLERYVRLELDRRGDIPDPLWNNMERYINEDLASDPYWCTEEPFSHQGGEGIYLLRAEEA